MHYYGCGFGNRDVEKDMERLGLETIESPSLQVKNAMNALAGRLPPILLVMLQWYHAKKLYEQCAIGLHGEYIQDIAFEPKALQKLLEPGAVKELFVQYLLNITSAEPHQCEGIFEMHISDCICTYYCDKWVFMIATAAICSYIQCFVFCKEDKKRWKDSPAYKFYNSTVRSVIIMYL